MDTGPSSEELWTRGSELLLRCHFRARMFRVPLADRLEDEGQTPTSLRAVGPADRRQEEMVWPENLSPV